MAQVIYIAHLFLKKQPIWNRHMTDVIKHKIKLIASVADARAFYKAPPAAMTGKIGLEVEMPLSRDGKAGPEMPDAENMLAIQSELRAKKYDAQLEAAGVLEYASGPWPVGHVARMLPHVAEEIEDFEVTAEKHGCRRAPYSIVPGMTREEAMDKMVPRERLAASIAAISECFPPEMLNVPLLTAGVQASFSPENPEQMFDMVRRSYMLTPLLLAAMNSSTGYEGDDPARKKHHLRGHYYGFYGGSGGLSESFMKAANAREFIDNHINTVFDAPMFFAYGKDGSVIRSTKGNVLTFRKLIERGLNTQSNYELAESFLYNDVKICNLRNKKGRVVGKRMELRVADAGLHQPASVLLIAGALVPSGETAAAFDALLKEYGFTGQPSVDAPLLRAARHAAVYHEGRFMDVPFGADPETGEARSLRDFAADVAGLLAKHYEKSPAVAPQLSQLLDILLTGECDARRYAAAFHSLEEAKESLAVPGMPMPRVSAKGGSFAPGVRH